LPNLEEVSIGGKLITDAGMVTYYVLFVIELSTRRVKIAGITPNSDGEFMTQCARKMTVCDDGFLLGKKYLIRDRDTKYTAKFDKLLKDSGTKPIKLPPRSSNLNSYAERYVLSIKSECLDRFVVFGEKMLWKITKEFSAHYHTERNHQGVGNELIEPP
jgi:transposase InsO family protein